jgi:hypothetical protein
MLFLKSKPGTEEASEKLLYVLAVARNFEAD